jgi:photosystem II stability/assembly factor-like uncharacterized protein
MKHKSHKLQATSFKLHIALLLLAISPTLYALCQQYGWTDISSNLPDFPYDTAIINNGEDTVIAGISGICFISANEGWIATSHPFEDSAAILHTTDGGVSWEVQMAESSVAAIDMLSAAEGYAASFDGNIYHTTNGGNIWDFHAPTFALSLSDMDFPPGSNTGYACGQNGTIFRISSSGAELMNAGFISDMKGICFVDPDHGWINGQGVMAEYKDGEWVAGHSYPSGHFTDVFFSDTENGWATGMFLSFPLDTVGIIHTSNDSSWFTQPLSIGNSGDMTKVFFLDNQQGWAVGSGGKIYSTVNGGQSWIREVEGMTNEWLNGVQFTSATNGYVCGNKLTLLKYGLISGLEIKEQGSGEAGKHGGVEVFPNPTRGKFQISNSKFQTNSNIQIQNLEIVDLYGKLIKEMVCGFEFGACLEIGIWNLEFDLSGYPAGMYFIRISIGNEWIVKKIVKL